MLVWKVVPDHFEIHEIVEKVILDLCTGMVTWKQHEGGKIKSATETSDADVRSAVRFACKHSTCTASIEDAQRSQMRSHWASVLVLILQPIVVS